MLIEIASYILILLVSELLHAGFLYAGRSPWWTHQVLTMETVAEV